MTSWQEAIDLYRKEKEKAQERKRVRDEKYWEDLEKAYKEREQEIKNPRA